MNRIDFSNLGGMPFTQNRADFLQQSYLAAFTAIANMCGDKTILFGVETIAGNVTDGWVSIDGELLPFIGGALGPDVVISETSVPFTFADNTIHDVQFTRVATCGVGGAFPFSDLVPLSTLKNVWLPGDIKEKYCDGAYIAANFDEDGYGINREKGWRIFSKQVPGAAGKTFVNMDPADSDFDTPGKTGGAKTHTLTIPEMPKHSHNLKLAVSSVKHDGYDDLTNTGTQITKTTETAGGDQAHNNMQPYFVILKLIKL